MMEGKTSKKQFMIYIIFAFVSSWIVQAIGSYFAIKGNAVIFKMIMAGCMFMPLLAVLAARIPLKGMGWIPHLKEKIRWVFFAMWIPALISLVGAVLYFIIFPGHFDREFTTMKLTMGEAAVKQLEAQGMTVEMTIIISSIAALTYGPFLNMIVALGEEVGWRGAMYPYLKERFGKTSGRIIGGIIWSIWHWPVMILAGYEYGTDYIGAPFLGLVAFGMFCVLFGILEDIVYEKTDTIWGAALFHGAINGWSVYAYLLKPEYMNRMIFGPASIGLISMIPMAGLVLVLLRKEK